MLMCLENEKIFSSFAERNVYEISGRPIQNLFGRQCKLRYLWNQESYELCILDFFENMEANNRKWMLKNWKNCFGGRFFEGNIIWPSDYIYKLGNENEQTSLGLVFCSEQFKNKTELDKYLNEKNAVDVILQVISMIKSLHEHGVALNGIGPKQLWYDNEERCTKIQVCHNTIMLNNEAMCMHQPLADNAKSFFQEKIYSIPQNSCWSRLPLGVYAMCNDVYSLSTLLFRALIGRHPLDGRLCDDQENDEGKMEIYNQNPCFIFSNTDKRNEIGDLSGEEIYSERWNNLDPKLRNMFNQMYTFPDMSKDEAEQKVWNIECFNLEKWIECLETLKDLNK